MKKTFLFLLLATLLPAIAFSQALNGTYYIGAAGTKPDNGNPDFASLKLACDSLNHKGVSGNVTMLITSDLTETSNVCLGLNAAPYTITFKPAPSTTPKITFTQTSDNTGASGAWVIGVPDLKVTSASDYGIIPCSNIIIDGSNAVGGTTRDLSIIGASTQNKNTVVIRFLGLDSNCTVKNTKITANAASLGYANSIVTYANANKTFICKKITFENNEITHNGTAGQCLATANAGSGTVKAYPENIVFKNNILKCSARGVFLNYAGSVDIIGNEFYIEQPNAGYQTWGIMANSVKPTAIVNIFNNKILKLKTGNKKSGYGIFGMGLLSPATYNVTNNFITGFETSADSVGGMMEGVYISSATAANFNVNLYHNSILLDELGKPANASAFYNPIYVNITDATTSKILNIKNNIIVQNESKFEAYGSWYSSTPATNSGMTLNVNNNNYYIKDTSKCYLGVFKATPTGLYGMKILADWISITNGLDANSVSRAVNFVSATDLHLTGSSVGDKYLAGTPISTVTTDIDGTTRSTKWPYMGSHEASTLVLPVELASFSAASTQEGVKLTWSTMTETNNLGFDIERKDAKNVWNKVGFVKGNGNCDHAVNYSYTDNSVKTGSYTYRLKQVDVNGKITYSQEIEVSLGLVKSFDLLPNYPNPFNPTTVIKYQLPENATVLLKIYDVLGKEVATLVNTKQEAGIHTAQFNASTLASGMYIARLQAGSFTKTIKMNLIK